MFHLTFKDINQMPQINLFSYILTPTNQKLQKKMCEIVDKSTINNRKLLASNILKQHVNGTYRTYIPYPRDLFQPYTTGITFFPIKSIMNLILLFN